MRAALRRTTLDNRIASWVRGEEGETPAEAAEGEEGEGPKAPAVLPGMPLEGAVEEEDDDEEIPTVDFDTMEGRIAFTSETGSEFEAVAVDGNADSGDSQAGSSDESEGAPEASDSPEAEKKDS